MNTKKVTYVLFICTLFLCLNCAKIPSESIDVVTQIELEGKKMHDLNTLLLNKMFEEKKTKINNFITNDYTPAFIDNIVNSLPSGTFDKSTLTNIISRAMPKIEQRKNDMISTLEKERVKLIEKLNSDYATYITATSSLKALLVSAVKLEGERKNAFNNLTELTGGKLDLNKIETELDKYVNKAGDLSVNLQQLGTSLTQGIDLLTNQKR